MAMSVGATIVVRLFEPISLLFPENAMPSIRATVPTPVCILCESLASPPSRIGWLSAPNSGFVVGADEAGGAQTGNTEVRKIVDHCSHNGED
jgi:hypothetical protein